MPENSYMEASFISLFLLQQGWEMVCIRTLKHATKHGRELTRLAWRHRTRSRDEDTSLA
jgi:hypothetical protein